MGMTRRRLLAATGTGIASLGLSQPAGAVSSAAADGTLTPMARAAQAYARGYDHDALIVHPDDTISMHIEFDEGKGDSIQEWVGTSSNRELLYRHDASRSATVRATPKDLGVRRVDRIFGDGLAARSWVQTMDPNIEVSLIEPVIAETRAAVDFGDVSDLSRWERLAATSPRSTNVAFDGDFQRTPSVDVLTAIDADSGIPDTSTVKIAVIDTGVNRASDDSVFGDGNGGTRLSESSYDYLEDAGGVAAVEDPNGHGTWVAAGAAGDPPDATHRGVARQARIHAARALDQDGAGASADIAAAVRDAADAGCNVLVMSLGAPFYSYEIARALSYAVDQGAIPVVAAGNDRQGTRWVAWPGSSDYSIAVGATTVAPPGDAKSAYFSNVGPHNGTQDLSAGETAGAMPTLGAPGTEIELTTVYPDGSTGTEVKTGTSMSGPYVGGVAAALVAGGLTEFDAVRDRLTATAEPVTAAGETEVGHGMVNARNALDNVEPAQSQDEARDDRATGRDHAYRSISTAQGRRFFVWG